MPRVYQSLLDQLSSELSYAEANADAYEVALSRLGTSVDASLPDHLHTFCIDFLNRLVDSDDATLATAYRLLNDPAYQGLSTILLSPSNALFRKWAIPNPQQQAPYRTVLSDLGTNPQDLVNHSELPIIHSILESVVALNSALSAPRPQTSIYHTDVLCQVDAPALDLSDLLISAENTRLNERLNWASFLATVAYLFMTPMAIVELFVSNPGSTFMLQAWNYVDTVECLAEAWQQFRQGETVMAWENTFAGLQMLLATLLVSIRQISKLAGHSFIPLSDEAASLLLGISFALSYWFCAHIEYTKAGLSAADMKALTATLESFDPNYDPNQHEELQRHLLIATARHQDQIRSTTAFSICFGAMSLAVAAAYLSTKKLSYNDIPLATLLVSMAIFATSGLRIYYTRGTSHTDHALESLAPPSPASTQATTACGCWSSWLSLNKASGQADMDTPLLGVVDEEQNMPQPKESLHKRLQAHLATIDPNASIDAPGTCWGTDKIPLRQYLYDLQFTNPKKLKAYLSAPPPCLSLETASNKTTVTVSSIDTPLPPGSSAPDKPEV